MLQVQEAKVEMRMRERSSSVLTGGSFLDAALKAFSWYGNLPCFSRMDNYYYFFSFSERGIWNYAGLTLCLSLLCSKKYKVRSRDEPKARNALDGNSFSSDSQKQTKRLM